MSEEIRTGDMVLNSDLGPMEAGEIARSHVNARAIDAVCLLMDNSLDLETLMQVVLQSCFVGTPNRSLRSMRANE